MIAARGAALGAAVLIAVAVQPGTDTTLGSLLLIPAALLALFAAIGPRNLRASRVLAGSRMLERAIAVLALVVFLAGAIRQFEPPSSGWWVIISISLVCISAGVVALVVLGATPAVWWAFMASYAAVATLVVVASGPSPVIDVALFQEDASQALFAGVNPFAITFIDPYPPAWSEAFYGPGVSEDGVLLFGYPYFPLSLFVVGPFEVLLGNFRWVHAAALVGSALMIGTIVTSPRARFSGMVFLLLAPGLYLIRLGWMDPLVVLALVGTIWVSARRAELGSWVVGLVFAMKQYTVFLAIPSLLLVTDRLSVRTVIRHYVKASAALIVTAVPFFLWGPSEFMRSVVTLQFDQPFRTDSIALPALVPDWYAAQPTLATFAVAMSIVVALSMATVMRGDRGSAGFAYAAGLVLLVAFALSKQAFANYYIVVIAALCAAVASPLPSVERDTEAVGTLEPESGTVGTWQAVQQR